MYQITYTNRPSLYKSNILLLSSFTNLWCSSVFLFIAKPLGPVTMISKFIIGEQSRSALANFISIHTLIIWKAILLAIKRTESKVCFQVIILSFNKILDFQSGEDGSFLLISGIPYVTQSSQCCVFFYWRRGAVHRDVQIWKWFHGTIWKKSSHTTTTNHS